MIIQVLNSETRSGEKNGKQYHLTNISFVYKTKDGKQDCKKITVFGDFKLQDGSTYQCIFEPRTSFFNGREKTTFEIVEFKKVEVKQ